MCPQTQIHNLLVPYRRTLQPGSTPADLPDYKKLAYESAAKCGRQQGPEVDEVTSHLQQVGLLLGGLLLGTQHAALQRLRGMAVQQPLCLICAPAQDL